MYKVVPEVSKPLLIFLNSCFFILFQLNVYFSLLLQIIDLNPSFLPFTVGSLSIFLYFPLYDLQFFLYFASVLNHFCEHPADELCILISASDIYLLVTQLFFWSFDLFFHLGHISLSQCTCYILRSGAVGIPHGGATHLALLWRFM